MMKKHVINAAAYLRDALYESNFGDAENAIKRMNERIKHALEELERIPVDENGIIKRVIIEYQDGSQSELEDGVLIMKFTENSVYRLGVGEFKSDDAQLFLYSAMAEWLKKQKAGEATE